MTSMSDPSPRLDAFAPHVKPPLGLPPKFLHDEHRLDAINAAIGRYLAAGMPIPTAWTDERADLERSLSQRHVTSVVPDHAPVHALVKARDDHPLGRVYCETPDPSIEQPIVTRIDAAWVISVGGQRFTVTCRNCRAWLDAPRVRS